MFSIDLIKRSKLYFSAVPAFLILFALAGCANNSAEVKPAADKPASDDGAVGQTAAEKTLVVIEHKCSGCGKCAQIDPEHFVFDRTTYKAEVVSTKNLDSRELMLAMSICRDRAIKIT